MDINTCFETTQDYHTIAFYSHLVPIFVTVAVSFFVLFKSKFSLFSKVFSLFTASFCLWLLGDVIVWTSSDYNLVSFFWAPLDYINIIFYLSGAYFFILIAKGKDLSYLQKIGLLALSLPAWWITITNQSIMTFYQPVCEAENSKFLSQYKLLIEILVIMLIILVGVNEWKKGEGTKRLQILTVLSALLLFFGVFSITEYISSQTGVYEINLYSLFVLPVFLFMIVFSISSLEILKIRLIGSQLIAYVLVIMVGSQFFFLENTTNRMLTLITFFLSLGFGILLIRSGKRESAAREKIEKLAVELETANNQLKELDKQKDQLLSFVSHELQTPVSAVLLITDSMMEGTYGDVPQDMKEPIELMHRTSADLRDLVATILDVSRIDLNRLFVDPKEQNLEEVITDIEKLLQSSLDKKKVTFQKHWNLPKVPLEMDQHYGRIIIQNLLSNAVKYSKEGGVVDWTIEAGATSWTMHVRDHGCGIPKADQEKIFGKGYRASNVEKLRNGNGFGLYIVHGAVEAHGGRIWFESKEGEGTQFSIEMPYKMPRKEEEKKAA